MRAVILRGGLILLSVLWALSPGGARAQAPCPWMVQGYNPTPAQWQQCWQSKLDVNSALTGPWSPPQPQTTVVPNTVLTVGAGGVLSFSSQLPSGLTYPNPILTGTVTLPVVNFTTPLGIGSGGTGAATAGQALANLGISNGNLSLNTLVVTAATAATSPTTGGLTTTGGLGVGGALWAGTKIGLGSTFTPGFVPGAQAGGLGSPWNGWLFERVPGQVSSDQAGLWPSSNTTAILGISDLANHATDPTGATSFLSPRWLLFLDIKTTDTVLGSVVIGCTNLSYTAGAKIYCLNSLLGGNLLGQAPAQVAHWECDEQGVVDPTVIGECAEFQVFTGRTTTVGLRFTANGTGKFIRGVDFSGATFTSTALKFGNGTGQTASFFDTGGSLPTTLGMDSGNNFNLINQTGGNVITAAPGLSTYLSSTAALTTNATTGFVFLPVVPGLPVGTPIAVPSWSLPAVIDYTDNKWCIYMNGGWKCVVLS